MAPCLHSDVHVNARPYWDVILNGLAIVCLCSFVYMWYISRKEQQEKQDKQERAKREQQKMLEACRQKHKLRQLQLISHEKAHTLGLPAHPFPPSVQVAMLRPTPMFFLVGDSTTADQSENGGGWGSGFLPLLCRGADGKNCGINGATAGGYLASDAWKHMISAARASVERKQQVFVTLQFGHNDQGMGVPLDEFRRTLVRMARAVLDVGAIPLLVSPLARRDFNADGSVVDNLCEFRTATKKAYLELVQSQDSCVPNEKKVCPHFVDLNAASLQYDSAIGRDAAMEYNLGGRESCDTTHLSVSGAKIFGRIVADLILGHPPQLVESGQRDPWAPRGRLSENIQPSPMLSSLIWHGKPA